jgi:hypothetical protein
MAMPAGLPFTGMVATVLRVARSMMVTALPSWSVMKASGAAAAAEKIKQKRKVIAHPLYAASTRIA